MAQIHQIVATGRPQPKSRVVVETATAAQTSVGLVAVIIAVMNDEPMVRVVPATPGVAETSLPSLLYDVRRGEPLEAVLRDGLLTETGHDFAYVEQLQAIAGAVSTPCDSKGATTSGALSIAYLILTHGQPETPGSAVVWHSWHRYFPWEDWRHGQPKVLKTLIEPRLTAWAAADDTADAAGLTRMDRVRMCFGVGGCGWDEEKVVERDELLRAAGLMDTCEWNGEAGGAPLCDRLDPLHRRSLAVAIGRLRAKIKSRPVVFDLMPEVFTLFELQRTVEAVLGPHLHKQNFRRLVEHMGLVEPAGGIKAHTGGRPAKLFRFRQSVLWERLQPGVRVRGARS